MVGRPKLIWAVVIVLALVASACSVLGDSDVFAEVEGSSSVPMVDPAGNASGDAVAVDLETIVYACRDWVSFRTHSMKTNLLDISGVVDMEVPEQNAAGDWEMKPFGVSRVSDLVDELTSAETICDVETVPAVATAIAEYKAEPDRMIGRQILYDAIDEMIAPFGYSVGESSAGAGPITPQRASASMMDASSVFMFFGDDQAAEKLSNLAKEMYAGEARQEMSGSIDAEGLLAIISTAELLALESLSAEARAQLEEMVRQEVIDAWKGATMCTEIGSNRIKQMGKALAKAKLLSVPDVAPSNGNPGFSKEYYSTWLGDWMQRREDAANGKRFEDCPGNIFRAEVTWPVGKGALEVYLSTCDYKNWTGEMSADITMPVDEGTMNYTLFFQLKFGPMEDSPGAKATADLDGRIDVIFTAPDATGKISNVQAFTAKGEFEILGPDEGAGGRLKVTFDRAMLKATVKSEGETFTYTFPVSWGSVKMAGYFTQGDGSCLKSGG